MSFAIGTPAPEFALKNQFGETVALSDFRGKKAVVLVFYPLAFSGTCTGELCEIRDNFEMFADADVELLGISVDSHFALRAFAEQEKYDFSLLADFWPHGGVAKEYGVFLESAGHANRGTFVIGKDGNFAGHFMTAPGEARSLASYKEILDSL
jgi:peroxiredoxin